MLFVPNSLRIAISFPVLATPMLGLSFLPVTRFFAVFGGLVFN
jgi:hypothetical protein